MNEELAKLIKANMKEGADITAIEKLAKGLNPLDGITNVEEAKALIEKTTLLKSANDSLVSIAVKSHDDKFTADKLPGIIKEEREKVEKELNPTMTKEQKTIKEQQDRIDALESTGKRSTLKTALQAKAKELGYGGDVELFVGLGDKAEGLLIAEAKRYKTDFDTGLSAKIKEQFGDTKPKTSQVDPAKQMKRSDYEAMNPNDQGNVNFSEITLVD
jgi:hypothetical protein